METRFHLNLAQNRLMKHIRIRFSVFLVFILLLSTSKISLGQEPYQVLSGTVRNTLDHSPISFAVLKNEMLKNSIIADEFGRFNMEINRGDLIKITAIGYDDGFYIINDRAKVIEDFPIQLEPRVYELQEFTLTPYKTILQFKNAFVQLELPNEDLFPGWNLPIIKHNLPADDGSDIGVVSFSSPISMLYNTFSHKGKMHKKYRRLLSKDYQTNLVKKRFTKEAIAKIVPFKSEAELDAFILFCQFDFSFLLEASDYELIAAVQRKYAEYQRQSEID